MSAPIPGSSMLFCNPQHSIFQCLIFCLTPTEGRKIFRRLRHCFTRATTTMVAECWRWCLVGVHAITLFLGSRGGRMLFLAVSALIEQHVRGFCLPNKKKTHLKPSTQLGHNVTPKAGKHILSTDPEQPQAKYSPLFGLLKPLRHCCRQSSTTCCSPCSSHRQCLSGEKLQLNIPGKASREHTWDTGTPTTGAWEARSQLWHCLPQA